MGLETSLLTDSDALEIFLFKGTEKVKHMRDLMNKNPDQTSNLGITKQSLKEEADADTRVLTKEILCRHQDLVRKSSNEDGNHIFIKLLKKMGVGTTALPVTAAARGFAH